MLAVTACVRESASTETLAPLPVSDLTAPPVTEAPRTTTSTSPPSTTTTVPTDPDRPVGDWDGARFDVGVIGRVGQRDGYRTIEFDRYSYQDRERGLITDATTFTAEPLEAWWLTNPYTNVQRTFRELVLSPDVELLVLDDADEDRACAESTAGRRPVATWIGVDVGFLFERAARDDIAVLTYSPAGSVDRVRFTRGC